MKLPSVVDCWRDLGLRRLSDNDLSPIWNSRLTSRDANTVTLLGWADTLLSVNNVDCITEREESPEHITIHDLFANGFELNDSLDHAAEECTFLLDGQVTITGEETRVAFLYMPGPPGARGCIVPSFNGSFMQIGTQLQKHARNRVRAFWANCLCQHVARNPNHKQPTGPNWNENAFTIRAFRSIRNARARPGRRASDNA